MKIEVITAVYNEEYLLPIFLNHYSFTDRFIVLYNIDSVDKTYSILNSYSDKNIIVRPFKFTDGLNDFIKKDMINREIKDSTADYVIVVDADEFIFAKDMTSSVRKVIEETRLDYYECTIFQMYPHNTENKHIDGNHAVWEQRKYGFFDPEYHKPSIFKPQSYKVGIGNHIIYKKISLGNYHFYKKVRPKINLQRINFNDQHFWGCHLNNVNLEFAIQRRLTKNNMSKVNRKKGFGRQYFDVTEEKIKKEFESVMIEKLW